MGGGWPWARGEGVDACERRYLSEGRYVWGLNVSGVKGDRGSGNGEVLLQWCVREGCRCCREKG